ncbi:MAG: outer membrane lipoprotein-sorting protein [Candidatus Omnitrophica bacterium]|nr:outer membrane lipoprotein-sorting protein [Candidatus Omnitrophota bacterium]
MRKITILITAIILVLSLAVPAKALTVDEIIDKANLTSYYAGADGMSDVKMTITDSQGRQRFREFRILRLNVKEGAAQKFYIYFKKPSDVAAMTYMVWKQTGRDDDRWLYLPALDLVRRIASSDKRSSFVGSHFVYEDVSGRGVQADVHELVEEIDGLYKIKNTPKESRGVEFKYYFVWIDKQNFMPMKAEYYNAQNKLIRTIEAVEIQDIQGYPTVVKSKTVDLERAGETLMEFSNISYDVGLTDNIFKERYLRKAPSQWIE